MQKQLSTVSCQYTGYLWASWQLVEKGKCSESSFSSHCAVKLICQNLFNLVVINLKYSRGRSIFRHSLTFSASPVPIPCSSLKS